jgi:hypothetical protein
VPDVTAFIRSSNWIIAAIGKHIIAGEALTGRGVFIGSDESTDIRIVISGLEVVQTGLNITVLANLVLLLYNIHDSSRKVSRKNMLRNLLLPFTINIDYGCIFVALNLIFNYNMLTGIVMFAGVIPMFFYDLTEEKHAQITAELAARKAQN